MSFSLDFTKTEKMAVTIATNLALANQLERFFVWDCTQQIPKTSYNFAVSKGSKNLKEHRSLRRQLVFACYTDEDGKLHQKSKPAGEAGRPPEHTTDSFLVRVRVHEKDRGLIDLLTPELRGRALLGAARAMQRRDGHAGELEGEDWD